MENASPQAKQRPDFNAMTRDELLGSFAGTVDSSDHTGQGEKRRPLPYVTLFVMRAELNAAISQLKGVESLDLGDGQGRRKSVVDSVRTLMPAVRVDEYTKGTREAKPVKTGRVVTGLAGLETISAGFGAGQSRMVGFDRDAAKAVMASIAERSDVQEAVLSFRSAQGHSVTRANAIKVQKAQSAAKSPRAGSEVGR